MKAHNNKILIDDNGQGSLTRILASTPAGLFAYGANYTTGANLLTTPASVAVSLTKAQDPSSIWTVNSPANGAITYSGDTRYFQIHCDITIFTASGGVPSTVTVQLQKQIGAGGWVNVSGAIAKRYLSSTSDTASMSLGGAVSMANGDDLRLLISSTSNTPTYTFAHVNYLINNMV